MPTLDTKIKTSKKLGHAIKHETRWLTFFMVDCTDKTVIYSVRNSKNGSMLGYVKWSGGFRKYVFAPVQEELIFDESCLRDIADFLVRLMEERKAKD
jgi:hypothetical protein